MDKKSDRVTPTYRAAGMGTIRRELLWLEVNRIVTILELIILRGELCWSDLQRGELYCEW